MRDQWRRPVPDFIGGWWESSRMKSVSLTALTRVIRAAAETRDQRAPEESYNTSQSARPARSRYGTIIQKFAAESTGREYPGQ